MYDVARLAGVSHQTVSRVINAHPNVREETRRRVQEAIAELGYRRNVAARTLVTRRSNTIGVITSVSPFWGPEQHADRRRARSPGCRLLRQRRRLCAASSRPAVKDVLGHFVDQGVEGIVVIAPEAAMAHMAGAVHHRRPGRDGGGRRRTGPRVSRSPPSTRSSERAWPPGTWSNWGTPRSATSPGRSPWFDATARLRGWRAELASSRAAPGPLLAGDWTAASGYRARAAAASARRLPSAIFVANDLMALGFIRAMHDAGIRVPEHVSIVGFDDMPGRRTPDSRADHRPAGPGHPRGGSASRCCSPPSTIHRAMRLWWNRFWWFGKAPGGTAVDRPPASSMSGPQRRVYRVWTVPQGLHNV